MTVEEYRDRMIEAFQNADCSNLIALVVQPKEKEFEHLEWLLKTHYKNEQSEDCVKRDDVQNIMARLLSDYLHDGDREKIENADAEIGELPSVQLQTKKGKWIIDDKEGNIIWHCHCSECKKDPQDYIGGSENWWLVRLPNFCPNCGANMKEVDKE